MDARRSRSRTADASRRALLAVLFSVGVPVVFVALASRDGDSEPASAVASSAARTYAARWASIAEAEDGEPAGAGTVFYDRAHEGLHELAASTVGVDRAAAARLLGAKQRVEAMLESSPTGGELVPALSELADATADAAVAVGAADVEGCR